MLAPLEAALRAEVAAAWAAQTDAAHDLGHLARVWANARALAVAEGGADETVLLAAAYLHDLVNLPKDHPDRAQASRLSARAAVPVLERHGLSAAQVAGAAHAIAAHSFSAGIAPETAEARILQDADRLDALGAVGLARMFAVAGALGVALADPEDPLAERRPPDDRRFALDHLETKLFRLPDLMHTATARQMAMARIARMRAFRADLVAELQAG